MLKKCLRPGAQTPRPPGTGGKRQPCGLLPPKVAKRPEGGERNEQRVRVAPSVKIERPGKAGRYELTLEGDGGKRVPCGHLPPKVAKRPGGVNRNERWARPALAAKIEVADLRALQTSWKVFVSSQREARHRRASRSLQIFSTRPT